MVKTYAERLRHPKWQKCRLQTLDRAEWACEECGAKDVNLQVHHGYYAAGLNPWEYPPKSLHVLCDDCHRIAEALLAEIRETIGDFRFSQLQGLIEWLHSQKKKLIETAELPAAKQQLSDAVCPELERKLLDGAATAEEEIYVLNEIIRKERIRQGIELPAEIPVQPKRIGDKR